MEENIFDTELGRKILALTRASFKVSDLISDLVLREKIKSHILDVYRLFFETREENYNDLIKKINILDRLFLLAGYLELVKEEHIKALRNGFLVFKSHIILAMNENVKSNGDSKMIQVEDDRPPAGQAGQELGRSITEGQTRLRREADEQISSLENISAKQKKILEKFKNKETLRLSEIMELFPDASEKTIRNELSILVNSGKIIRSGWGSGSFYKLVK